MARAGERLRAVRAAHRRRDGARSTGDLALLVYSLVLLAAFVGVPVVHAVAQTLAGPAVLSALAGPSTGRGIAAACGLLLAGAAAAGAVRGPALLPPFLVAVLAGSDLPRRAALARPFVVAALVLVTALTGIAVLLAGVLVLTGTATPVRCTAFVLAVAAWGVVTAVVWLTGQRLGGTRAGLLSAGLLAATLLTAAAAGIGGTAATLVAAVTPWGWVGLLWPTGAPAPWSAPALLATAAVAAAGCAPALLGSLSGPALLEQAQRWQVAGNAARTADAAGALATYRARPHLGRSWPAVRGRRPADLLVRDLVGALRTPGRLAVGTGALVVGAFVTALGLTPGGVPAWLAAAVGAGTGYAGLGVVGDGFRHAAEAATAPPLYGWSTTGLYARHAALPTAWALGAAVLGVGCASAVGAPLSAVLVTAPLAVLLVALRARDSAKGPLPPVLLTPAPTPAGDASGLVVLAWQADALLLAAATAAVAVAAGDAPTSAAVLAVAAAAAVTATRRRLRRL